MILTERRYSGDHFLALLSFKVNVSAGELRGRDVERI